MENTETGNTDLKLSLLTEFQNFEKNLNGEAESAFHKIRKDAFESFKELGFPNKKLEDWKYTNLNPILKLNLKHSLTEYKSALTKADIKKYLIKDSDINLLVFVNGHYDKNLSEVITKDESVFIGSFSEGMKKYR
ncbi:MAG: Fe-S cluster assembly protein SufD, partial [Ignavibacteria bacterium]|nr:Fe-S cluster assembly protein SufD [Ignavibacteria bacterium]